MRFFAVVNRSTLLGADADRLLGLATLAVDLQLHDVAEAWGTYASASYFPADKESDIPSDATRLWIFDSAKDAVDELGDHTEDADGTVHGRVLLDPILSNGCAPLHGTSITIPTVMGHEAIETTGDPFVNCWWEIDDARTFTPREFCDAVEGDSYDVTIQGQPIAVTNYLLPNWSNPAATSDFDRMGTAHKPFEMTPGGYLVVMKGGEITQTFGEKVPDWRKALARRRLAQRLQRRRRRGLVDAMTKEEG